MKTRTERPLTAYLILVAVLSGAFVIAMRLAGEYGNYLAGPYMFTPAIAALFTRLFFYDKRFKDARLGFGRWRDYLRFWWITLAVVAFSYIIFTLAGAISWDLSGGTFLGQLEQQMEISGKSINDLPEGMTPKMMLILFFAGGLTILSIPTALVGFGEEFGWRGLMFPLLCRDGHLLRGFVTGGLIWFAWHLPLMLVMPSPEGLTVQYHILNAVVLAVGSIFTFAFFAWAYLKSGTIWVGSFVHAVFNNASRSFAYFAKVENQLLANIGLAAAMILVVAFLSWRGELKVFREFLQERKRKSVSGGDQDANQ
ncbi:MAG: CPBP family intramembrane metalloprotease [Candidatus Krumholzibacteriota bacterium]|nr:CPBP family intramembrane metalloprotease [Candidatus Krumholzibacteriota bacterium]